MWENNCYVWCWWNCQMWEKSKGTTKCEKRTITCGIGTTQYKDESVKCDKKVRELPNVRKKLSHAVLDHCIVQGYKNRS